MIIPATVVFFLYRESDCGADKKELVVIYEVSSYTTIYNTHSLICDNWIYEYIFISHGPNMLAVMNKINF